MLLILVLIHIIYAKCTDIGVEKYNNRGISLILVLKHNIGLVH